MEREENLIGRWAVCGIGRIGRIHGRRELDWGLSWVGTGIDGTPWASRNPKVICDRDALLLEAMIREGSELSAAV